MMQRRTVHVVIDLQIGVIKVANRCGMENHTLAVCIIGKYFRKPITATKLYATGRRGVNTRVLGWCCELYGAAVPRSGALTMWNNDIFALNVAPMRALRPPKTPFKLKVG